MGREPPAVEVSEAARPPAPWQAFRREWVVYEDDALLVVDKPEGVPTQRGASDQHDDLTSRLRGFGQEPYLSLPQHLERDVSGLVVLARSRQASSGLVRQFEQREVLVGMVAWVRGDARCLPRRFDVPSAARPTPVTVEFMESRDEATRLVLKGPGLRAKDLRAALLARGYPLVGEPMGEQDGQRRPDAPRLLLHVASLELTHPLRNTTCRFECPMPPLFERGFLPPDGLSPTGIRARLAMALERRYGLALDPSTTACRLVNAAGDGLPDMIVDRYDRWAVVHYHGEGDAAVGLLLDALVDLGFAGVYLKRQPRQANVMVDPTQEDLAPGLPVRGRAAPATLEVLECGLRYQVHLAEGLRTGLFVDQRDNRQRVRSLADGQRVLNLFAYTGSFSLAALAGGASEAVSIDASRAALEQAQQNIEVAGLGGARHRAVVDDVFVALARLGQTGAHFDGVVVDPPTYSSVRGRRFRAPKDYPVLLEQVLRIVAPGGWVLASMNHRGTSLGRFRHLLMQGLKTAGRQGRIRAGRVPVDMPQGGSDDFGAKSLWIQL